MSDIPWDMAVLLVGVPVALLAWIFYGQLCDWVSRRCKPKPTPPDDRLAEVEESERLALPELHRNVSDYGSGNTTNVRIEDPCKATWDACRFWARELQIEELPPWSTPDVQIMSREDRVRVMQFCARALAHQLHVRARTNTTDVGELLRQMEACDFPLYRTVQLYRDDYLRFEHESQQRLANLQQSAALAGQSMTRAASRAAEAIAAAGPAMSQALERAPRDWVSVVETGELGISSVLDEGWAISAVSALDEDYESISTALQTRRNISEIRLQEEWEQRFGRRPPPKPKAERDVIRDA